MRPQPLLLGLLWASVTVALTITTWLAVSLVAEEVGGSGTQVLSADAVQSAAASPEATPSPAATPTPTHTPAPSHSSKPHPSNSPRHHTGSSPGASSPAHSSPPASPRPSSSQSSGGTATKSRTFAVSGGTVTAACTGSTISLRSASPTDGWRVDVKDRGPEHVEVSFESGEQESEIKVRCSGGAPVAEIHDDDSGDE